MVEISSHYFPNFPILGMKEGVTQGPLINDKAVEKVSSLVKEAVSKGAKVVIGGEVIGDTNLYKPTILTEVTGEMEVAHIEIFGPVVAIQKFTDEADVIQRANDTRFGLAGEFKPNLQQRSQ